MENQNSVNFRPFLLQASSYQVWVQALARLLYQAGYGTIQFFIPLIFVNQLGFSATVVGAAIGTGSLAGVLGHLLGGYLADSPKYGRKKTLLISAWLSIIATVILLVVPNLSMLVVANLIMGLSAGCYWTAADAAVMDIAPKEQRQQSFAVLVLADSLGIGLGIMGGGILLAKLTQVQVLFGVAGLLLLLFFALIQFGVPDTQQDTLKHSDTLQGFISALKNPSLQLFVLINILFTTYIALVNTTLPLYFTVTYGESSLVNIANLFTWCYIGIGAVLQLPLVQILRSLSNVQVLMISMVVWGVGFFLVWATHLISSIPLLGIIAAFSILSITSTMYKPFAPAIIGELAPEGLRGIYLAISYQCWSIGYFLGPTLGGWAMDQSSTITNYLWIGTSVSTLFGLVILYQLEYVMKK